jgi:hypothetical protein
MTDFGDDEMPPCVVPQKKQRRIDHESPVHVAVKRYLEAVLPTGTLVAWIRNEIVFPKYIREDDGLARARYMDKLKAKGFKPGLPDLMIAIPDGRIGFMEIKPFDRGQLNADQIVIHRKLYDFGIPCDVVRSIDDARATVAEWGWPTREAA